MLSIVTVGNANAVASNLPLKFRNIVITFKTHFTLTKSIKSQILLGYALYVMRWYIPVLFIRVYQPKQRKR